MTGTSSWVYPPDGPIDEWRVVLRCNGVEMEFHVRRRFGQSHQNGRVEQIETFQLLRDGEERAILTLPCGTDIHERARAAAVHTLGSVLGYAEVVVVTDGDPVVALLGP
jgi:hypothetical protein